MQSLADKAKRVTQVYTELDRKFEEQETQRLAQEQKIPYMNLYGFPVDVQALSLLPKEIAQSSGCAVFYKEGHNVKVAQLSGSSTQPILAQLKAQGLIADVYMVSKSSFKRLVEGYRQVVKVEHKAGNIDLLSNDKRFEAKTLADLGEKLSHVSATEMIDMLVGSALILDSSDIHVEPESNVVKIRFRIDGVLQDVATFTREIYQLVVSRIKILSKLKLNVVSTPQDGSFGLTYNQKPVDIRVSLFPSAFF